MAVGCGGGNSSIYSWSDGGGGGYGGPCRDAASVIPPV